jgi:chitin disaccharide deacetylase
MSKYLILNCDDFGQSRAANAAIIHLLEEGKVSSATIMPPAPAFEEAAAWGRSKGSGKLGLHLTLTSEFTALRWKSLSGRNSLHDETGFMHKTVLEFEKKAKSQDVKAEIAAQFQAIREAGLNITHVDNHMGSLYGMETGRSHLPYVLWQCSRRGLPFRIFRKVDPNDKLLAAVPDIEKTVTKVSALADTLGVGMPDYLLSHPFHVEAGETYDSFKKTLIQKIYNLPEGVCETYFHPGIDDVEMRRMIPSWEKRVWEFRLALDEDFAYALRDAGVILTDYRYIRDNLKRSRLKSAVNLLKLLTKK